MSGSFELSHGSSSSPPPSPFSIGAGVWSIGGAEVPSGLGRAEEVRSAGRMQFGYCYPVAASAGDSRKDWCDCDHQNMGEAEHVCV